MEKIIKDTKYDYNNVLIKPNPTNVMSRNDVSLECNYTFKHGCKWNGVPVIAANMDTTGTFEINNILSDYNMLTSLHKFYNLDDYMRAMNDYDLNPEYFMVSTGISDTDYNKLIGIVSGTGSKWICIDVANGYMSSLVPFCKKVRKRFPDKIIVVGNVATREKVKELLEAGADIIKIGIGPGSACTTRKKTGVGVPQLSAVLECAQAARESGGHIIADGGITCPGDMAKAFCAGASFVMGGGMFAGHSESPGDVVEKMENGVMKKYKEFYGMSSKLAMEKHYGKMNSYRTSEGRKLMIPYKGDLQTTVEDYLGGLRSTCTYTGVRTLLDLYEKTVFILVTQQVNDHFIK